MSSSAISAQGSVLAIGTGAGAAKTLTAIALGNPTILTSTAHGFANGDVVTLAGFTGTDAATLNGQTVSARNITANTFAVNIDTTGKTITAAGSATSTTFTNIANVRTFSGFDGSASEIDVTNLDSIAKEFRLGLTDPGQFTFEIDYDSDNAGHIALRARQISGTLSNFKLTLPNATVITFSAYVKKFSLGGGVDAVAKTAVDLRISGAVGGL
ncbi:Phage tail tube protein, TTP [Collimonas sp. OK607]|uniref:phage tail tube protein n=1 Tax=Collimonas sp. OK607 TaxID=1798194 RepID=UPI0008F0F122|nr:phage tail tube protein [Collimonas sp. OK607]SFB02699.1 Phage tail tube protein, TTP [Collimonas sp. OK607]